MKWTNPPTGSLVLAVVAAGVIGACTSEDRGDIDTGLTRAVEAISEVTDSAAARVGLDREYTSGEAVGFINAMNDAEVEVGEMAVGKATDAEVKAFAQRIITEHRKLKADATAAAQANGVTPVMPGDDDDLRDSHRDAMRSLADKAKGREFDEAFVEHEVHMHRKALDRVKDVLEDNKSPELRTLLEQARAGLEAHLKTAEELEKKFGA